MGAPIEASGCDCVEVLEAQAAHHLELADRAARDKRTRIHEPLLRRRFTALGWAAGYLRLHRSGRSPPADDPGPAAPEPIEEPPTR